MMFRFNTGFSMVELLVVLLIISLVLSLTAPLTIGIVDKFRAKSELSLFVNKVRALKEHSFFAGGVIMLSLNDDTAIASFPSGAKETYDYQYLRFDKSEFAISPLLAESEIFIDVSVAGELQRLEVLSR